MCLLRNWAPNRCHMVEGSGQKARNKRIIKNVHNILYYTCTCADIGVINIFARSLQAKRVWANGIERHMFISNANRPFILPNLA